MTPEGLVKAVGKLTAEAWSFNRNASEWEPILEPWDLLLRAKYNPGSADHEGGPAGIEVIATDTCKLFITC